MIKIKTFASALLILSLIAMSRPGIAIDVDPRDYTALPPGANLSILYAQFITADDLHVDGNVISDDFDLDAAIGIYRFVHFTKFMGLTVDPQVLIPFGDQEIGLLDDSSAGLGDVIFATTFWFHENHSKREYFGITPFIVTPTGEYNASEPVNLGTNRWSYILQAGYMTRLTKNLGLDLTADIQWYGDNDDPAGGDTLEQEEGYQIQAMLHYDFTPTTFASLRYSWREGDETILDGVAQNNAVDTSTLTLGIHHWLIPSKLQMQAQYLSDIDVGDFGPERTAVQLRFLYLFGL